MDIRQIKRVCSEFLSAATRDFFYFYFFGSISDLVQIMQKTHPEQLRIKLQQEVTDREIQDTLFFMDGDKAHGPQLPTFSRNLGI